MDASLVACFIGVRGSPYGGDCLAAMGASLAACFVESGFRLTARIALRQGFAGSALHPQGTSSLDPDKHKNPISIFWEGGRVNHGSAVQPPYGEDYLTAMDASLVACFMGFESRLSAGIALRQ